MNADPLLSRAVLVGAARFENMHQLPAVRSNLAALADVLRDDRFWGLPDAHCMSVPDPLAPQDMLDPIKAAASEATDTLLLYYAGHGLVDPRRSELHLALTTSDRQRMYTAVAYATVRDLLLDSRAVRRIVILDCCYSGRALGQMADAADALADAADAEGTFLVAAAAENQAAMAPGDAIYTAFTGELLAIFRTGITGAGPLLDLDTIFQHLRAAMQRKGFPVPQKRERNTAGQLALIHNQAYQSPAAGVSVGQKPEGSAPSDPQAIAVCAEWALYSPKQGGHLLTCSDEVIDRGLFDKTLRRYSPRVKTDLPQVTLSRLQAGGIQGSYLGIAIHDSSKAEQGTADRNLRTTRYFCVPYQALAEAAVSYEAFFTAVSGISLPPPDSLPVDVRVPVLSPPAKTPYGALAARVAALLLTGDSVCILRAKQLGLRTRLRFIDSVMSLLPYGMRTQMSATTLDILRSRSRLYFSDSAGPFSTGAYFSDIAAASTSGTRYVMWETHDDTSIGHPAADSYLDWLGTAKTPAAILAAQTTPMGFTHPEVDQLLEDLGITAISPKRPPVGREKPASGTTSSLWENITTIAIVAVFVAVIGGLGYRMNQEQYYVGADSVGNVFIYRGYRINIGRIHLPGSPYKPANFTVDELPTLSRQSVESTIHASSLASAQSVVAKLRSGVTACEQQYSALKSWTIADKAYKERIAQARREHKPTSRITSPGPVPEKAAATCGPSQAYGISPSDIPSPPDTANPVRDTHS